jgi:proteic killer suppression protein
MAGSPTDRRSQGTWSLWISGNWRLTFRIEADEIVDLDLEDYH